ncbi:hypothetical protein C8J56DRAFT_178595 [Mycena floridula]|nr:hypothetical protein C8J56DRAFT_178595 [Mycena floridula]
MPRPNQAPIAVQNVWVIEVLLFPSASSMGLFSFLLELFIGRIGGAGNTACVETDDLDWYTDAVGETPCKTYQPLGQTCNNQYQLPAGQQQRYRNRRFTGLHQIYLASAPSGCPFTNQGFPSETQDAMVSKSLKNCMNCFGYSETGSS